MLFRLRFSREMAELSDNGNFHETVREVLSAHRRGIHLFVPDRESVNWMIDHIDLNGAESALLSRLSQSYTQNGSLHNRCSHYVEIGFDSKIVISGSEIIFPWTAILSSSVLATPFLLVENLENDGWLYEFIIENLRKLFGIGSVNISISNGGGSSIASVFEYHHHKRHIVFALVDSDKKSPCDTAGDKIGKLLKVQADFSWPFGFCESLPCKEVENLIPPAFLITTAPATHHDSNQKLMRIHEAEQATGVPLSLQFWSFFDLKNGLEPGWHEKLSPKSLAWTSERIGLAGLKTGDTLAGYGERILPSIRGSQSAQTGLREHIRDSKWLHCYRDFFATAAWLFVSAERLRT